MSSMVSVKPIEKIIPMWTPWDTPSRTHFFYDYELGFQVLLEKQDHKAVTISNKPYANIKTHYKRDIDIMWFTQYGIHPHINF